MVTEQLVSQFTAWNVKKPKSGWPNIFYSFRI